MKDKDTPSQPEHKPTLKQKEKANRLLFALNVFDDPLESPDAQEAFKNLSKKDKLSIPDLGALKSLEQPGKLEGIGFEIKRRKKEKLSVTLTFPDSDGNPTQIIYALNGKKNTMQRRIVLGNATLIIKGVRGTEPVPGYIRDVLRYFTADKPIHDDTIHGILADIGDALLRMKLMTLGAKYPEDWEDFKAEVLAKSRSLADLQSTIGRIIAPYRQDVEHPENLPRQAANRIMRMSPQINLN